MVEHLLAKERVGGSNPLFRSSLLQEYKAPRDYLGDFGFGHFVPIVVPIHLTGMGLGSGRDRSSPSSKRRAAASCKPGNTAE